MKNVWKTIAAVIVASFVLSGCGNAIPDMSAEEEQAMGEYAALILLRYDTRHRSRLVDLSKVPAKKPKPQPPADAKEDNPAGTPSDAPQTPVIDNASGNVNSIEALFGLPEGVAFAYQGMQICTSYQERTGGFFNLEAAKGKSLLVLKYTVGNQSGSAQRVNLYRDSASFQVAVNGSAAKSTLMTMLPNDMTTYDEELPAGENRELVLVVEIDAGIAENVTAVSLQIKNELNAYTISIL